MRKRGKTLATKKLQFKNTGNICTELTTKRHTVDKLPFIPPFPELLLEKDQHQLCNFSSNTNTL